ncbi:PH domain-containing protein [Kitasatospora setae]|uniref:PH domain-containing protein n=1 Tax=Kitasatospora setae TaxID=2066 RepID=UPI000AF1B2DA|nr:PH domain-containing protein [Kitasatospora setae]
MKKYVNPAFRPLPWLLGPAGVAMLAAAASPSGPYGTVREGLLGAVALFYAVRTARLGVVAGPDGVRVRNLHSARTVRWERIEGFALAGHLEIRLRDGGTVSGRALEPGLGFPREHHTARALAELEAALAAHRPAAPAR